MNYIQLSMLLFIFITDKMVNLCYCVGEKSDFCALPQLLALN